MFSKRIEIPSSATLSINALALQKKAKGERVYNLSAGEPMIDTPQVVKDAAITAVRNNKSHYTSPAGIATLREAASSWMNTQSHTDFLQTETFVTNGGKYALYALAQILLQQGDEALIIAPYWVSYKAMVQLAGATPVIVSTSYEQHWKVTPAQLEAARTPQTKVLFFNNGANPTGVLYTEEEVKAIVQWAQAHNIILISDEVYAALTYDGQKFYSAATYAKDKRSVIVVQSVSKAFAMTGWRVGFVFADEPIIKKLSTLQGQSTSNTTTVAQYAAIAALEHAQELSAVIRDELRQRRNVMLQQFEQIFDERPLTPKAGLYVFAPLGLLGCDHQDSVLFCETMLEEKSVAMVPGAAFGVEGFVRLSFGVKENEIIAAMKQLRGVRNKYQDTNYN